MSDSVRLREALRQVGAAVPAGAPASVHAHVLREFRRRKQRRAWRWMAGGAVAAGLVLALVWQAGANPSRLDRKALLAALPPRPPGISLVRAQDRPLPAPPPNRPRRERRKTQGEAPFYLLPGAGEDRPGEEITLVRVETTRAALELAGIPVAFHRRDETVQAELLLAETGQARAIRVVNGEHDKGERE